MFKDYNSIYLDFDGTITKNDTVNSFFKTFADIEWLKVEQDWIDGKIDSKTCMQMQLKLIKNLTKEKLYHYLDSIEIQDGFIEFCLEAKKHNLKLTILSDGFDFFIDYILRKENLENISFYSNKLTVFDQNEFLSFELNFPNADIKCDFSLGTCKCAKIQKDEKFIYAGDGLSDRCIASKSNLLFAKNSLKNHCLKNKINFIEFNNFFDILSYLSKEGDI